MKLPKDLLLVACLISVSLTTSSAVAREYADGRWRALEVMGPNRPSPRKHHAMSFDPGSNLVVLYGGETKVGGNIVVLGDVWVFNLNTMTWTEVAPAPDPVHGSPGSRHGHSATYSVLPTPRMIIFGGRSGFGSGGTDFLRDTWALTISPDLQSMQWILINEDLSTANIQYAGSGCQGSHAVSSRTHSAVTLLGSQVFMMGGLPPDGGGVHDTWSIPLTGEFLEWSHLSGWTHSPFGATGTCYTIGEFPDTRYYHTIITDTGNAPHRLFVFGGEYDPASSVSNVYSSTNGISWSFHGRVPAPEFDRVTHVSVYDPIGRRMLVVGGKPSMAAGEFAPLTIYHWVTSLDLDSTPPVVTGGSTGGDWTRLEPANEIQGAMAEHAGCYDTNMDRVIVFGGVSNAAGTAFRANDLWALEFDSPPAAVMIGGAKGRTNAAISWVAPGDDGDVGTAAAYDLRRSSSPITEANFGSALQITTGSPQVAGSTECVEVSGLVRCNTYYYALKTRDTEGNWSPLSNVLSLTQNCTGGSVICLEGGNAAAPVTPVTEFFLRVDSPTGDRSVIEFGMAPDQAGESYEVAIFDVAGRRVRVLQAGVGQGGAASAIWDHFGNGGEKVSSGLYFVRLRVGSAMISERLIVTR